MAELTREEFEKEFEKLGYKYIEWCNYYGLEKPPYELCTVIYKRENRKTKDKWMVHMLFYPFGHDDADDSKICLDCAVSETGGKYDIELFKQKQAAVIWRTQTEFIQKWAESAKLPKDLEDLAKTG